MSVQIQTISLLPNLPSIYGIYANKSKSPVYVGQTTKLKNRITQHLVRRDSSIVTGASGYSLDPDHVKRISWWEHHLFVEENNLTVAELIAFNQLNPIIRSQGNKKQSSQILSDENFVQEMVQLFQGEPTGELNIVDLNQALQRISKLEDRIRQLEEKLK